MDRNHVIKLVQVLVDDRLSNEERIRQFQQADATEAERASAMVIVANEVHDVLRRVGLLGADEQVQECAHSSLLNLSRREAQVVAARGYAIGALVDRLGTSWSDKPGVALVDVLKTIKPGELRSEVELLSSLGVCDLDDLIKERS